MIDISDLIKARQEIKDLAAAILIEESKIKRRSEISDTGKAVEIDLQKKRVLNELWRITYTVLRPFENNLTAIRQQIRRQAPNDGPIHREIRAFLRGLTARKRDKILRDAIDDNDRVVAEAVIFRRPYLSGMTKDDVERFKKKSFQKFNDGDLDELAYAEGELQQVKELLQKTISDIENIEDGQIQRAKI